MKRIPRRSFAPALLCSFVTVSAARGAQITVVTSGAFTAAWLELAPQYESASHDKLATEFGPSMGTTHNAIPPRLRGAEAIDVVIMAAAALADVIRQGRIRPDSRVDLVQSKIGKAVK